jgi:hypothetical protein
MIFSQPIQQWGQLRLVPNISYQSASPHFFQKGNYSHAMLSDAAESVSE